MAEWLLCVILRRSRIFSKSMLIYTFFIVFFKEAAFCRVLASVCKAKLRLGVNLCIPFKYQ